MLLSDEPTKSVVSTAEPMVTARQGQVNSGFNLGQWVIVLFKFSVILQKGQQNLMVNI